MAFAFFSPAQKIGASCLEDAAKAVVFFALTRPPAGIYNLVNPGSGTNREIADLLGLRKSWFGSTEEFERAVKAPRSIRTLSSAKLTAVYPMRPVRDALADYVGRFMTDASTSSK